MKIIPIDLDNANQFVKQYHRHLPPVKNGYKFCCAVEENGEIIGVAIVGLPVSRAMNDGFTLEVRRTCTNGAKNANSMLYGACWRAAKALGYRRLITYTMEGESGASLRGAGWQKVADVEPKSWNMPNRKRTVRVDIDMKPKTRWEAVA